MKILNLQDLEILGAAIPSVKEIENLTEEQRAYTNDYWLRTLGISKDFAISVYENGNINYEGDCTDYSNDVRPILIIENLPDFDLQIGEEVEIDSLSEKFSKYIVLNEHILLANFDLGDRVFFKNTDNGKNYWTSQLKKVVDRWFEMQF